ncbi:MAG: pyrimidine/purine nucleoside phosphorylase [Syntrophobacteraceae bacterium]|jgi:hypothetical protein|nr:pyrimidine/purine nucleoside phosphorylase [Syntrophobacteraceae bacterium]
MRAFEQVNVVIQANVYFDGKVTSRTVEFADGSRKTLGIMLPGEYEFQTGAAERMEITAGVVEVRSRGAEGWRRYAAGEHFEVEGNSSFQIKVLEVTDYVCSFLS